MPLLGIPDNIITIFTPNQGIRANYVINDDVIQKIITLAASAPPKGHRRWSAQLLCDMAMEKGIVEHIGLTTMCQILKGAKNKNDAIKR